MAPHPRTDQPPISSRQRASMAMRQSLLDSAQLNEAASVLQSAESLVMSISTRYFVGRGLDGEFDIDLHDLWYHFYLAGSHLAHDSPQHDQAIVHLLHIRDRGALSRSQGEADPDSRTAVLAHTTDGVIWVDLPFFVSDMMEYWANHTAPLSVSKRLNFAVFLAKLASLNVRGEHLSLVALVVLHDTLESKLPLDSSEGQVDADANRITSDLCVAALLPSANAWLFHAGNKLLQLSEAGWMPSKDDIASVSRDTSLVEKMADGFSPERWMNWLSRLEAIANEAKQGSDESLLNLAEGMIGNMLLTAQMSSTSIRNKLEAKDGGIEARIRTKPIHMGNVSQVGQMK